MKDGLRVILVVSAVIITAGLLTHGAGKPGAQKKGADSSWAKRIDEIGAEKTYAQFKQEYSKKPFAEQHNAAHVIGVALYEKLGIQGFSVCDESFAFGCYHAFFGRAIAEKGTGIIPQLADACRKRYGTNSTGCEHGIGHGIMEYLGPGKLVQGLELCERTDQANELFGCTSGAFMEYNSAVSFPGGNPVVRRRAPDTDDLHAPCNTIVPERFRDSCYFEIGLWWKDIIGDFGKVGNMCADAPTRSERASCWRGWGTVVAENVEYSPVEAGKFCALIADDRGVQFCRIGVAMRFFGAGKAQEGRHMCEELDPDLFSECNSLRP